MKPPALKAIKSVYAYYFPEVRKIVDEAARSYPHDLLLKSVFPGLDGYHEQAVDLFINSTAAYQSGLKDFSYRYYANGSSEAIFHLLVHFLFIEKKPVYVLEGEYEGYREYAKNLGAPIVEVPDDNKLIKALPPGVWFISNPSARNGNIISNSRLIEICEFGHEIVLDLAYMCLTRPYLFDLTHPRIRAVAASLSKPYGLFYTRVGFTFSRMPLLTLYPNIWFKNIFSIKIAEEVMQSLPPGTLYQKYLPWQSQSIAAIKKESGLDPLPSDALLLSYLPVTPDLISKYPHLQPFQRGKHCRFCLTPYFLDFEAGASR